MCKLLTLTLFVGLYIANQAEQNIFGHMYSKEKCNGVSHELEKKDGDPDLTIYLPNRVDGWKSASFKGAWLFYSEKKYWNFMKHVYHPTKSCISFGNELTPISARPVRGSGVNEDGITFYAYKYFTGRSTHVKDGETELWLDEISSYIITGNSSWSLYGGHHFEGDMYVTHQNPQNNLLTFVPDVTKLQPPIEIDFIRSAKKM